MKTIDTPDFDDCEDALDFLKSQLPNQSISVARTVSTWSATRFTVTALAELGLPSACQSSVDLKTAVIAALNEHETLKADPLSELRKAAEKQGMKLVPANA